MSREATTKPDLLLLGMSLEPTVNFRFMRNAEIKNREEVRKRLEKVCREYKMPERIAHETFRRLYQKNKHWYSFSNQIRQLIEVLEDYEDYPIRFRVQINMIKQKYETNSGV